MYVAISNELVARVQENISTMRNQELKQAAPDYEKEYAIDASHLYNVAGFQDHIDLLNKIPKKWLSTTQRARVFVEFEHTKGNVLTLSTTQVLFNNLKSAYSRPTNEYPGFLTNPTVPAHVIAKLPDDTPGKAEVMQRVADAKVRLEITDRWKKIEDDVCGFLRKCKSLNEAIKLVPTIKLYVNKEDIERLERKVERKPREEVVVDIDVDNLTASAVAARLQAA